MCRGGLHFWYPWVRLGWAEVPRVRRSWYWARVVVLVVDAFICYLHAVSCVEWLARHYDELVFELGLGFVSLAWWGILSEFFILMFYYSIFIIFCGSLEDINDYLLLGDFDDVSLAVCGWQRELGWVFLGALWLGEKWIRVTVRLLSHGHCFIQWFPLIQGEIFSGSKQRWILFFIL